ncbi:helix-turn-helix domain-containing protein [Lacrimispora brassicae]
MDFINLIVAENLKRLREQRKMSLDAAAKASGVSKSMLGQIERGEVNPTISTVWKIAGGFKVPFTELVSCPESEYEVVDTARMEPLLADDGHYRNYPVFPFDSTRRFEMLYIELDPDSRLKAAPHPENTQEFVMVFSGELEIQAGGERFTAARGGAIRFQADCSHEYHNTSGETCRLSMVIYYPD